MITAFIYLYEIFLYKIEYNRKYLYLYDIFDDELLKMDLQFRFSNMEIKFFSHLSDYSKYQNQMDKAFLDINIALDLIHSIKNSKLI